MTKLLEVAKFADLKPGINFILIGSIDLTFSNMKLVCELSESNIDMTGGCFLENGEMILVSHNHSQLLH